MSSLLDTYVAVYPDTGNFDRDLRKKLRAVDAERAGKDMGGRFGGGFSGVASKAIVGLGGAFAALGVGKFFAGAVKGASDLAETQSKVGVLFGQNAKDIQAFAKSAGSSLGQTERQAMDAAATFATFGKSAGLQGPALTKFSTGFTSLASDLASFNNTSPEQAIDAIGSALRGEAEPLRAYGVLMDDASLRQEALRLGLIKTTKEALTPQQKVLAAQALIYKQTGAAQGDFARTSDGLANKQRIMKAQFEGIKTTLGSALLPVVLKGTTVFAGFLEGLEGNGPVAGFSGALNTAGLGVRSLVLAFKDGDMTSDGFVGVMERIGVAARTAFGFFRDEVLPRLREFAGFLTGSVVPAIGSVVGWLNQHRGVVVGLAGVLGGLVVLTQAHAAALALAAAGGLASWIKGTQIVTGLTKVWAAVQWVLNAALSANPIGLLIVGLVALGAGLVIAYKNSETFRNIVQAAWEGVQTAVAFAWNDVIKPAFTALAGFVTGTLVPTVRSLWTDTIQPAFEGIGRIISFAWNSVIKPVLSGVSDFVTNVLAPVFTFLWQDVIQPAFEGIGFAIKVWWAVASVIFAAVKLYVEDVLAPMFTFLWRNVVEPVFKGIGAAISFAWDNVIKPVFNALGGFITETVAPAFRRGVDAIGSAWDRIKEMAAAPIRFVVNTVIQKGIIENFNKIADAVGSNAKIPSVSFGETGGSGGGGGLRLQRMATGGFLEDHRAQIAPAGTWRVWAEPETGGEAYIPLAPAKRERSMRIWEETGRRLGALERFAHGGFSDRGFGGVKPNVARAGNYFAQKYGIRSIGGVAARPGNPTSDHPKGLALDFMTSGENGTALANEAIRDANHFGVKYVIWRQRINSGSGWRQMADRGNPTANHMDHPHVSFTGASGGTGGFPGVFGGILDFLGGLDPVEWIKNKVAGLLGGMPGAGKFGDMAKAVPGKIISTIASKLRELPGNLLDTAGSVISRLNPFDGGGGSVRDIVQRIAAGRGWGQGSQWADLQALIQRESSWNPRAQNPTSTAYGLFQFLNSTWAGTGYAKTSDPATQTLAGLKYIAGRYGSPSGAWAFHRRNNWYDAGGVATGPGMMPKLTSAPERVLSPRQTEAFERLVAALDRGAAGGRAAPLVGEIHTHDAAGLDLVLQQAQFRERAGHFG